MKKLIQMKTIPMVIIPLRPIPFCSSSQQISELRRRALRGRMDWSSRASQFEQVVAPSGFSEPHLLQNTIDFSPLQSILNVHALILVNICNKCIVRYPFQSRF